MSDFDLERVNETAEGLLDSTEGESFAENEAIFNQAAALLQQVLESDANDIAAHFNLARIYLHLGEAKRALVHAQTVYQLNPQEPNILLNLGVIHRELDDTETGLKFYKRELARDPENPDVLFNLGLIYFERHRWKTSARYFEKSFQLNHRVDEAEYYLVLCYRKINAVDQEINLYKRRLKSAPKDAWATQNLGASLIDIGEYEKALFYLRKTQKIHKDLPEDIENEAVVARNVELAFKGSKRRKNQR